MIRCQIKLVTKQRIIPQMVGRRKERNVYFMLPVSFFMVSNVVVQGKCNKVIIITLIAVNNVQPFWTKISPI